jgi:hypothetical protein
MHSPHIQHFCTAKWWHCTHRACALLISHATINIYAHVPPPPTYTTAQKKPANTYPVYISTQHSTALVQDSSSSGSSSSVRCLPKKRAGELENGASAAEGAQRGTRGGSAGPLVVVGVPRLRDGAHRRSASDSAAFLEAVPMDDVIGGGEFDRLDDEQLMSMFSDGSGDRAGEAPLMDVGDAEETSPAGAAHPKRVKRLVPLSTLPPYSLPFYLPI